MKYYTTREVAEILGLTDRHYVYKQIKNGKFGKTMRVGKLHMLTKKQIEEYAESRGRECNFGVDKRTA